MTSRHNRKAATLGWKSAELGLAVPLVVAHRVARMARAGSSPNARDRREFTRMGTEKVMAFNESWMAMWAQAMRIQQEIGVAVWRSWWSTWTSPRSARALPGVDAPWAALRMMSEGMAPIHRRATANARRLGRVRIG
jgi:hypothetical protein